jgi:hypothetical protein
MATETDPSYMTPGARRAAHRLAWSLTAIAVVLVALTSVSLIFQARQADFNHCQQQANARFQQTDISRAAAARVTSEAQITLWDSLFKLHGTPAQRLAEFTADLDVFKQTLRKQVSITYPAQTAQRSCGG